MSWLRRLFRRPKGLRFPNGIPRTYISLDEVFDELERVWAERTPRVDYNTVDLVELNHERARLWMHNPF